MEFNTIVGHERPRALLSSVFEQNRFPHALLFSGPLGVGKYTMALELVRHLFCDKKAGCGRCRACLNVARGTHPDFRLLRSDTTIGIDELRSIRKEVYEPPYEAPLRVVVIDGAEQMTREAQNALLKTLEEPPPSNMFILVTSSEKDLPLTIRSRCMHIGFGTIRTDAMKSHLMKVLDLSEAQAELVASLSWGSMSSAFFWMNEENFNARRKIAEFVAGRKHSFIAADGLAELLTSYERDARFFLYFLLTLFRDMWVIMRSGDARSEKEHACDIINRDLRELLASGEFKQSWIETSIKKIQETIESLRYNINRWLAFESLAISIMGSQ